jgi:hypothetical protein
MAVLVLREAERRERVGGQALAKATEAGAAERTDTR